MTDHRNNIDYDPHFLLDPLLTRLPESDLYKYIWTREMTA